MVRNYKIAVLPGDGIGPEVMGACLKVLDAVQEKFKFELELHYGDAGENCVLRHKTNLPKHTIELLEETDACLKAPMTNLPGHEDVAEKIRKRFDLNATVYAGQSFAGASVVRKADFLIVRERTEGLNNIEKKSGQKATASRIVTAKATESLALLAVELALERQKKVTIVNARDTLKLSDTLFRDVVFKATKKFKKLEVDECFVDEAASLLINGPESFDVLLTENMVGRMLAGECAGIFGRGMLPVAHMGKKYNLFETYHGSAQKYTNMNRVNPLGMILAGKVMLQELGEHEAAKAIGIAVKNVLAEGRFKTYDLEGSGSTNQVADAVATRILKH